VSISVQKVSALEDAPFHHSAAGIAGGISKTSSLLHLNSRDYTDEELDQLCVNSLKTSNRGGSDVIPSGNESTLRSKSHLFKDVPLRLRWTTRHGSLVPFNVYLGWVTCCQAGLSFIYLSLSLS
jgi:hypothetical protein